MPFLLRSGWRLMRLERSVIARQTALGAHACDQDEALARLSAAAAGRSAKVRTTAVNGPPRA
ncbi:hypothetical protein SVIOM342S_00931 [Streptomyces violaceorubidus]